jgi:hypothetical protein
MKSWKDWAMKCLPAVLAGGVGLAVYAHERITTQVTWDREISRLAFSKCVSCHREGGTAFSLETYTAARPWAKAIKEETLERRMPPFGAVKGFADLRDDQSLSVEQLELISDWVEGGAPEGDPKFLPATGPSPAPDQRLQQPRTGAEISVDGTTALHSPITVCAIKPKNIKDGGTLRAIAQEPDGSIVPLIWIYQYKSKFERTYYFRRPFTLPAGTKVVMSSGELSLLSPAEKETHTHVSH